MTAAALALFGGGVLRGASKAGYFRHHRRDRRNMVLVGLVYVRSWEGFGFG